MRKTLKLSLTLVLAFVMLFAVAVIASAETAEPTASGDWSRKAADSITWSYYADTQTLVISGKGQMADAANASDSPWYGYRDNIVTLIIEEGVTRIGKNAFNNLTKVTTVTIPDSVTIIAKYAFSRMRGLNDLYIGTGVTEIGHDAFASFSTTCDVHIKDIAAWCSISFGSGTANPVSMGSKSIYFNEELIEALVFPSDVTSVAKYAFRNCKSITSVTFNDEMTSVGTQAFGGCTKLKDVYFGNCIIKFGNYVFKGCNTLVNTYVSNVDTYGKCTFPTPNSTPLGSGANRSCLWIDGNKYAKRYANQSGREYDTDAASILIIPDGVTTLNANVFRQRTRNLTTVIIPESVVNFAGTSKNNGPFAYCNITTIYGVAGSAAEAYAAKIKVDFVEYDFGEDEDVAVTGVTLDVTSATLTEGETITLTATVEPNNATDKTVTWSSNAEGVATVVDGLVTAVAEGTATITAKAGEATATCVVTVNKKVIAVTGITLDVTDASLEVNETLQLNATVAPADATDKTVTWRSDVEGVATVVDGLVTAVSAGKAVITATAGDFEATCTIVVADPAPVYVPVEEILLDVEELTIVYGETYDFTVTFTPDDATDKSLYWESSNEDVATIDEDGKLTAIAKGIAIITVISEDNDDAYAECVVEVTSGVAVEGISLNKTTVNALTGDVISLEVIFTPADATNKNVSWTTSNDAVVSVEGGVITAVGAGVATLTATSEDGEFTATCKVIVTAGNETPPIEW